MTKGLNSFAADLTDYAWDGADVAALGVGVFAGQTAWNYAKGFLPSAVTQYAWVAPLVELAAGVAALLTVGQARNKWVRQAGVGAAAGLGAGGVMGLAAAFKVLPAPTAGLLMGAPVTVDEVAGLAGAPVTVDEVTGNVGAFIY